MLAAVVALGVMNSPYGETYQRILDQPIKVGVSPAALQKRSITGSTMA